MELTFIGLFQIIVGSMIVLAGDLRTAFLFLLISAAFSGSAAILLPALGGSSIPPVQFALLFVCLRLVVPAGGYVGMLPDAMRANWWLVLFTLFGMVSAYLGPRIFAGMIDVYPTRHLEAGSLFERIPLEPTSQNATASFYLLGALLIAMISYIACRRQGGAATLLTAIIVISWVHVITGFLAAIARGTPFDIVFEIFRNGNYSQMDDDVDGLVRIRGLFPETSSYAGFGLALFVTAAELWYRSIRSLAMGAAALGLALVLFFSTSSTAYIGLAAYFLFFVLRQVLLPTLANVRKAVTVATLILALAVLCAVIFVLQPEVPRKIANVILQMTVEKSTSSSGQQRLFWAMQGLDAFTASYGLGIGAGSFRTASIFLAILGSMGVIGIVTFLAYVMSVFQPWRRSSWVPDGDLATSLGGAFGTSAVLSLIPLAINSTNAHPGPIFTVLAGGALALRPSGWRGGRAVTPSGLQAANR